MRELGLSTTLITLWMAITPGAVRCQDSAALPETPRHLRHSGRIRAAAGSPTGRRNRQRFDAAHAKRAVPTSAETAVR